MPRTVILRFSDYEIETIPAHTEIIRASGSVWWGWWKKKHEPDQIDVLASVSHLRPFRMGLVNRTAGQFYLAQCTEVAFDAAGSRQSSPNPQLTPIYYRDTKHPAWFRFAAIEELKLESFIHEFGDIPLGDPTLFVVDRIGSETRITPSPSLQDAGEIRTKGDSILHISDLHFGQDHGFVTARRDDPTLQLPVASVIYERIKALGTIHVGIVVVSGDIITQGDANGYPAAYAFLESLLKNLALGKEHTVIVPGNHDIWLRGVTYPTSTYEIEQPFRLFLKSFYGVNSEDTSRLAAFRLPGGWKLSFIGLNSSRPRTKETMDYGYVGQDRYSPLLRRLIENNSSSDSKTLVRQKILNFAVLHHHLLPASLVTRPESSRPVSLTLDAGQLVLDLQAAGVHVALHGHQHIPFLGTTARAQLPQNGRWPDHQSSLVVIGSGSSGAKVERLWDDLRNNTFGIYTPSEDGLDVRIEEFNQNLKPRTFMDTFIPLFT